jgi:hypothetical protein
MDKVKQLKFWTTIKRYGIKHFVDWIDNTSIMN